MKRIFYPFVLLLPGIMLVSGIAAKAQSYTINFPTAAPTDFSAGGPVDKNDNGGTTGIETGVKFYVTQPGTVTGIRYFRSTFNSPPHIGHIWTNTGTLLLTSAALPEVGNGWQEGTVSLHVTTGNTYVASVFNSTGDYAVTTFSFGGGTDYGTAPIKVLATGNDPVGNGVFIYSGTSAFPNGSNFAPNYWIDIRFVPDFSLPVGLIDFNAATASNDVLLSWKTSSETNNRGFDIQRSNNGSDWYNLNFVNGAGESTIIKNYNYTDKGLAPGVYYYRLQQTDFDGKGRLSSVVKVTVSGKGIASLFQNYPNPFSGTTTIRFDLPTAQKARLSIFDMMGREVKVLSDQMNEAGSHLVSFNTKGLGRQLYSIRLKTETGMLTKQILVQ